MIETPMKVYGCASSGAILVQERNNLRLYIDSDRNGIFSKDDDLIGVARIRNVHRRCDRRQLLNLDLAGAMLAMTIYADHLSSDQHVMFASEVDLRLLHSDGSVVALFAGVEV